MFTVIPPTHSHDAQWIVEYRGFNQESIQEDTSKVGCKLAKAEGFHLRRPQRIQMSHNSCPMSNRKRRRAFGREWYKREEGRGLWFALDRKRNYGMGQGETRTPECGSSSS